jgi:hypothetical protein
MEPPEMVQIKARGNFRIGREQLTLQVGGRSTHSAIPSVLQRRAKVPARMASFPPKGRQFMSESNSSSFLDVLPASAAAPAIRQLL